jgi:hypothetical protein
MPVRHDDGVDFNSKKGAHFLCFDNARSMQLKDKRYSINNQ